MHSPVRVLHISGARSLSDYLQETKFGGIKTFDRFMIVDPGAFCAVVFFVERHYLGYSDKLLESRI